MYKKGEEQELKRELLNRDETWAICLHSIVIPKEMGEGTFPEEEQNCA